MRIWDQVPPSDLCGQHLLAQWAEGLGLWAILTQGKKGYANHPETRRWIGRLGALHILLYRTREAMLARDWNPQPLPGPFAPTQWAPGPTGMPPPWDDQLAVLRAKNCECRIPSLEVEA